MIVDVEHVERLTRLRASIDAVDSAIVRSLDERARLVAEVRRLKVEANLPLRDETRERQVIGSAVGAARICPRATVKRVFEHILEAMVAPADRATLDSWADVYSGDGSHDDDIVRRP